MHRDAEVDDLSRLRLLDNPNCTRLSVPADRLPGHRVTGSVTLSMSQAGGMGRRVVDVVLEQNKRALSTYASDPGRVEEDANNERRISQGGYGDRQIFELVQNGADELRDYPRGEIRVVLTGNTLYCANEGSPVTAEGAESILRMSVSRKRGGQIGRFGVGVKSVLAVSDAPQFFSKDKSGEFGFGFHKAWAREQIQSVVPDLREAPVLRMAQVLDVDSLRRGDAILDELMSWATTVVRLPLVRDASSLLARDLQEFEPEFFTFFSACGIGRSRKPKWQEPDRQTDTPDG